MEGVDVYFLAKQTHTWSYNNRSNAQDRGDIVDFEARRGARTATKAREALRPQLAQSEYELEPQDGKQLPTPSHGSPEHDPGRKRTR
jgi:hypothetical protein